MSSAYILTPDRGLQFRRSLMNNRNGRGPRIFHLKQQIKTASLKKKIVVLPLMKSSCYLHGII